MNLQEMLINPAENCLGFPTPVLTGSGSQGMISACCCKHPQPLWFGVRRKDMIRLEIFKKVLKIHNRQRLHKTKTQSVRIEILVRVFENNRGYF